MPDIVVMLKKSKLKPFYESFRPAYSYYPTNVTLINLILAPFIKIPDISLHCGWVVVSVFAHWYMRNAPNQFVKLLKVSPE